MIRLLLFGPAVLFGTITHTDVAQWAIALAGAIGILAAGVATAIPQVIAAWHKSWDKLSETQFGQFELTKKALDAASKERKDVQDELNRRDELHRLEVSKREARIREILDQNEAQLEKLEEQSGMILTLTTEVGKMASNFKQFKCPNAVPGTPCANAVCPTIPLI